MLASEQWTLVETYERDGKQYAVARRNDVQPQRSEALSPREREALHFASFGVSNKEIAYQMRISASTVGVFLYRAAHKLVCHSRVELLSRFKMQPVASPGPEGPTRP
jgi:DNA-binding NarL/FixJ family response regulator